MCGLCSDDERQRADAIASAEDFVHRLEKLATLYKNVLDGRVKPHTEEFIKGGSTARAVIRDLVEDWV